MQTEETMTTTPTSVSPADENIIGWFDGKKIDELAFCEEFVKQYNFKYFEGCFYNLDGVQEDAYVESLITTKLKKIFRILKRQSLNSLKQSIPKR